MDSPIIQLAILVIVCAFAFGLICLLAARLERSFPIAADFVVKVLEKISDIFKFWKK